MTIRVVYDWNRPRDKHFLMAVFTESDVFVGKFVSTVARSRVLINQYTGINPTLVVEANADGKPMNNTQPGKLPSAAKQLID